MVREMPILTGSPAVADETATMTDSRKNPTDATDVH
jgi:hypothetical protein